jgi:hypothetical protein
VHLECTQRAKGQLKPEARYESTQVMLGYYPRVSRALGHDQVLQVWLYPWVMPAGVRVYGCAGVRVCDMFDLHERSSRFGGSLSKSFLCHIADEHGRVEVGGEIQRVMDVNVRIC